MKKYSVRNFKITIIDNDIYHFSGLNTVVLESDKRKEKVKKHVNLTYESN